MDSDNLQESAKATKKGLEVAEKVGGFIADHIGGSIEQGMGVFEDKFKYYRATNQLKYIKKFNELANGLGVGPKMKPVPLKLALPLFEVATLA